MKKKMAVLIAVLVCFSLVAGSAYADGGGCSLRGDKKCHSDKGESIKEKLNLTPEQDKLLKEAKESHRAAAKELLGTLKEKREALKKALGSPDVTKQDVEPIANEIKALQAKMVDGKIDSILGIKRILTVEQYNKLQEMKADFNEGGRGHKRHGEKS